jgi:hypothetical protein
MTNSTETGSLTMGGLGGQVEGDVSAAEVGQPEGVRSLREEGASNV